MTAARGRPLSFDPERALTAALRVFCEKGYDGASMTELTEAMGVNRPSLYSFFGNKEALFIKALDLYERERLAYMQAALAARTAKGVAEALLSGALKSQADRNWPPGCLSLSSTMASSTAAASVRTEAKARRVAAEAALLERFMQAKRACDLPKHVEPASLARLLWTITQGLSLEAANGADFDDLCKMAKTTLAIWPGR